MADASMQTIRDAQGRVKGYRVRWRNRPGILPQQPSKTFDKGQKALAEAFLARVRYNSVALHGGLPAQSKISLDAFYRQHFLPSQASKRATSKATMDSLWTKWIMPVLGNQDIASITTLQLEALLNRVKAEGHFSTARKVRSLLKAIWMLALRLMLVQQNLVLGTSVVVDPADESGSPKSKGSGEVEQETEGPDADEEDEDDAQADQDGVPVVYMNSDEVEAVVATITPHFRPFVITLAITGMRIGEASALRVRDVNLDAGKLNVRRTLSTVARRFRVHAGQSADQVSSRSRTKVKTPSSRRAVCIPADLVELLRPLVVNREGSEPLFTMQEGGVMNLRNFRKRHWVKAVKRSGLKQAHRPHALRHYAASMLFDAGVDEIQVAAQLGHKDSTVTRRIYGHLLKPDTAEAAQAMALPAKTLIEKAAGGVPGRQT